MNFDEIEKYIKKQLCSVLNPTCLPHLEVLLNHLMYHIKLSETTIHHERYGTMRVKNQQYYSIDIEYYYNYIKITLWYNTVSGYKSKHIINVKT